MLGSNMGQDRLARIEVSGIARVLGLEIRGRLVARAGEVIA
jgi:hypothetical protein